MKTNRDPWQIVVVKRKNAREIVITTGEWFEEENSVVFRASPIALAMVDGTGKMNFISRRSPVSMYKEEDVEIILNADFSDKAPILTECISGESTHPFPIGSYVYVVYYDYNKRFIAYCRVEKYEYVNDELFLILYDLLNDEIYDVEEKVWKEEKRVSKTPLSFISK
jgi:hypothetical protein